MLQQSMHELPLSFLAWTTATLCLPVIGNAATSICDIALFAGGLTFNGTTNNMDIFNATSNTWSTATLSFQFSETSVGKLALFAGGWSEATVDIFRCEGTTPTLTSDTSPTISKFSVIMIICHLLYFATLF
jgi:hypothetical protein